MGKGRYSRSGPTEDTIPSVRIKNTFDPDSTKKYFDAEDILMMYMHGFPRERMTPEARKIGKIMSRIHYERSKDPEPQLRRLALLRAELDAKEARGESTLITI